MHSALSCVVYRITYTCCGHFGGERCRIWNDGHKQCCFPEHPHRQLNGDLMQGTVCKVPVRDLEQ